GGFQLGAQSRDEWHRQTKPGGDVLSIGDRMVPERAQDDHVQVAPFRQLRTGRHAGSVCLPWSVSQLFWAVIFSTGTRSRRRGSTTAPPYRRHRILNPTDWPAGAAPATKSRRFRWLVRRSSGSRG